jgi:hypothetical protein
MTAENNNEFTVHPYEEYVEEVEGYISEGFGQNSPFQIAHLNGEASDALRRLVPVETRKHKGIFFTPTVLADKVAERLSSELRNGASIYDPACGAGSLLVACAKYLPLRDNANATLEYWSELIFGNDLFHEFVRATKLRLSLVAISRHGKMPDPEKAKESAFPGIVAENLFLDKNDRKDYRCVVVNPPYYYAEASEDCSWGSGRVQYAAVFVEHLLRQSPVGQRIVALLPDVLRSGVRYRAWRKCVGERARKLTVETYGQFDSSTSVDVFLLDIVVGVGNGTHEWVPNDACEDLACLDDMFEVSIGPLVEFRREDKGGWHSYVDVSEATPWGKVVPSKNIRFAGTVFRPPFVVIRRTSSPRDKKRLIGTIIKGDRTVAVENHLIVLKPKNGTLRLCGELLKKLNDPRTDDWINTQTRCRHISAAILKKMPWWKE